MLKITFLYSISLAFIYSLIATSSSFGSIGYRLETDGSGVFTGGSYTGTGAVQNNVDSDNGDVFVVGLTSGTLSLEPESNLGYGFADEGKFLTPTGVSLFFEIGNGGTADLRLVGSGESFQLINISSGVSSISVTATYTQRIAGRAQNVIIDGSNGNQAWGMGIDALSSDAAGNRFNDINDAVSIIYGGIIIYDSTGTTFTSGTGTAAGDFIAAVSSDGFSPNALGGTFVPIRGPQNIQGIDLDGNGSVSNPTFPASEVADGVYTEIERAYARSTQIVLTGDNLGQSETFGYRYTLDGRQWADTFEAIPEPSSSMLMIIGASTLFFWRRRRIDS